MLLKDTMTIKAFLVGVIFFFFAQQSESIAAHIALGGLYRSLSATRNPYFAMDHTLCFSRSQSRRALLCTRAVRVHSIIPHIALSLSVRSGGVGSACTRTV
jgi:hypothetical protein